MTQKVVASGGSEQYCTLNLLIVTEKDGKIKIVNINSKNTFEVKHNLNILNIGQGGLLDIIYQDNYLWVSYSEDRGNGKTSTSIATARLDKKGLKFPKEQKSRWN